MAVYRRNWKDAKTGEDRVASYYFKFVVDGVTYKETVKTARTKKQAEEAERRARQDVHEGIYGRKDSEQLFTKFVKEVYLPYAKQHLKQYRHHELHAELLCGYFAGRTLRQITTMAVEGFKLKRVNTPTKYGKARSPHTVNGELTTLSSVFALAVRHKQLRENPCHGVRWMEAEGRPVRRLAEEEEEALLESADRGPSFLAPMIRLALWTGFRQGELIALGKSAIDHGRGRVYVRNPKWKRDHRKTEGIPVGREVRELLARLCAAATGELLFPGEDGRKMPRHVVDHYFRAACARAGVTGLRFHDLRHEFGSRLGDADVNLKKIARLMGHARTKQTERYVHPSDDGLVAAVEVAASPRSTRIVPAPLRIVG